jgi:hypothetical protein
MLVAALLASATAGRSRAVAADGDSLEPAVKAAYLAKFGLYVDWPGSAFASPASPLNLCVTGGDPFGELLDRTVANQHIGTRPIVVRRLESVSRDSGCQILYVSGSDARPVADAVGAVRGAGVLTVADAAPGGDADPVIRFVIVEDHVRFAIDAQAASRNGLTISSKLLSLALSVKRER